MVMGVSLVPLMDGIAKGMAGDFHVLQIVWARFTFHLLWLLPFLWGYARTHGLVPRHPGLQVLRGGLILGATLCYFSAIALMPIADALALLFISPMVTTVLSPLVLGERVGPWRWSAVIVGFIGALIVVRPGAGVFQWASVLALCAGVFHGCYLLTTRRLAGSTNPVLTLFYTGLVGALGMTFALPVVWVTPSATDWGLMVALGAFAASGHFLIIRAFDTAPAPVVAPVAYAEIVAATAVGWFAFGDFPAPWTWAGITVIVASGTLITVREGRAKRHSTTA
jgi:drug/metabolite transporter (DMT)-like permease